MARGTEPRDKDADDSARKYRAPALEKGLDVLELLARSREPMTTSRIAGELGRSVSELFRMVLALEHRGYIVPAESGVEGYTLSNKLFALGIARTPTRALLELALPAMEALTREIHQSCHIALASGDQIVVVGRVENPGNLGFAVRVGYRRPLARSASGLVLYAFQDEATRTVMRTQLGELETSEREAFFERVKQARARGHVRQPSGFSDGVTDLSAPLIGHRGVVAALTVPFVRYRPEPCTQEETLDRLCATAASLSETLRQQQL